MLVHQNFIKVYKKLPAKQQQQFKERRDLWLVDQFHPLLHNHSLQGRYCGYRSINITGDLRAIYKFIDEDTVIWVTIGSHSFLYS